MYNEFYGFSRDPFLIVPDPNFLYMSPKHEEALARLVLGIKERRAIILITGEVGAGKTTLIRFLSGRLPAHIQPATVSNSNLGAEPLLRLIMAEFGQPAPAQADKSALIKGVQDHLERLAAQNRRGLLIVDEAQNLPIDALEEIRMLSNLQRGSYSLLQTILVGQPELRARMKDRRCIQIAQRIALNYHIDALSLEETRAYIVYRLRRSGGSSELFTADAVERVFKLTRGIPRLINLVCDSTLIYGFSEEQRLIDAAVVTKAARQLDLMGLVSAVEDEAPEPVRPTAAAAGGNGDGAAAAGALEESLARFIDDLRQEVRKIVAQTGAANSAAMSLSLAVEKLLEQERSGCIKVSSDSSTLALLRRLLSNEPKR
ncbi:MAG: AAA family ATPase [Desulfobacterales bacterium]|nr:AAA family ATPase [Desulfobacterales bacterium]